MPLENNGVIKSSLIVASSFRVSLVIDLGYPQDLEKMPSHFYDK